jgi:hypothetical protein
VTTPHDELDPLIFDALANLRHVGASPGDIRAQVGIREKTKHSLKDDLAALRRFEEAGKVFKVGRKWFLTPRGAGEARGSALEPSWRPEDSWVLLALLYNHRSEKVGSRLMDIVATADFIEHAIVSREELHGALNRLLAGGLIERKQDRFRVTERALSLFNKVEASSRKFVHDHLDALERILKCPCCGVRLKDVRWRIEVEEPAFKTAVEAYVRTSPKARSRG